MNTQTILKTFAEQGIHLSQNEPLKKYTSLRVGGPADYFLNTKNPDELNNAYTLAKELDLPVFVLGMGTNILIGDKGIRGLVIKNSVNGIHIGDQVKVNIEKSKKFRRDETHWRKGFLELDDIKFDMNFEEGVEVKIQAGTPLSYVITYLLSKDVTGLEYFSGIPGTFGGAVWNNVHGADWLIEDFLQSVEVLLPDGTIQTHTKEDLGLNYDYSIFHKHDSLILSAKLHLPLGDVKQAKFVATEWSKRKSFQPKNSAGCSFGNISEEQRALANLENCGTGYIVDRILNLRGKRVGDAWISEKHANFIETGPNAKASNVVHLIEHIKLRVYAELGIWLHEEVLRVGEF